MSWFRKRRCINAPYCDNPNNHCSRDNGGCEFSTERLLKRVLRNCNLPEDMTLAEFKAWQHEQMGLYVTYLKIGANNELV